MFNDLEKVYIWLSLYNKITIKKYYKLLDNIDPLTLFKNFEKIKAKVLKYIDETAYEELLKYKERLDSYILNVQNLGIEIITYKSKNYPKAFKDIKEPPLAFYAKGNISLLNEKSISVVGTRRCTKYGREVTESFTKDLARAGLVIVSGLADGVDSVAHKACLEVGGKTIAVLGSGINEIYPASNKPLAEKIINSGGLIISEYKPSEKPQNYYFPYRNRLIAGLSFGVLITEATEKSGSMHTKEYACEYGKEIYAVPGRVTDIYSKGCNHIIKNCQSAMVLSAEDILEDVNISFTPQNKTAVQADYEQQIILNILEAGEAHIDELIDKSKFDIKKLNTLLTKMELFGLIKKLPGNFYSK